ncbi:MAG: hypothetical protein AAGN15_04765 [Cyanobacteria bacterium J06581_3]
MADQPSFYELSPQLGTVLKSLSVSLDAELNRYRRNRRYDSGVDDADLFGDLEAASFDIAAVERAVEASLATVAPSPRPLPPPLPPNKKLAEKHSSTALPSAVIPSASADLAALQPAPSAVTSALATTTSSPPLLYGEDTPGQLPETAPETALESSIGSGNAGGAIAPSGYLASSEGLIESLSEVPPMPEPVDTVPKPKRKTVSLLAGASLGFVGLAAGLGASYLMANPLVTQRITSGFRTAEEPTAIAPASTFDPPGPDLSANEFIDLDIDNLSSLKMPQSTVNPTTDLEPTSDAAPADAALQNPTAAGGLPPIEGAIAANPAPTAPPAPIGTQAVVVPVGLTYYVTTPFVTQQNLDSIRASVSEAFVRRFADGNRIQIAAFDNPQAAQVFIEELKTQNIEAQIYGPTTE